MEVYPLCSYPSWDTLWNCFCLRERLKPHVFAVHGTGRKVLVSSYFENYCGFCSNRILHYFPLSDVRHRRDISTSINYQLYDDLGH